MSKNIRVSLAQINPCVGDLPGNIELIKSACDAHQGSSDMLIFPELCLTAYPPEDLLLRDDFMRKVGDALNEITRYSAAFDAAVIIGHPLSEDGRLYNAASVIHRG